MGKFAKLFDVDEEQVLVQTETRRDSRSPRMICYGSDPTCKKTQCVHFFLAY